MEQGPCFGNLRDPEQQGQADDSPTQDEIAPNRFVFHQFWGQRFPFGQPLVAGSPFRLAGRQTGFGLRSG